MPKSSPISFRSTAILLQPYDRRGAPTQLRRQSPTSTHSDVFIHALMAEESLNPDGKEAEVMLELWLFVDVIPVCLHSSHMVEFLSLRRPGESKGLLC